MYSSKSLARRSLLALASALALAWPLGWTTAGTGGAAQGPRPAQIVLGMVWEPVSFNPIRGIDSGSYIASSLVYESLVKYDANMNLTPALAESFEQAADGLSIRFLLLWLS